LGASSFKIINMDYFWEYFNRNSGWYLEAWDAESGAWIDVTEYLNIISERSEDNQFEKISLEFTAPMTNDYRLIYTINKPIKSYVDRSFENIYELVYAVGNDEYLTYFDYNDIAVIPDVIIDHGVKNIDGEDRFYFSAQRNNVIAGTYVYLDPIFGNDATSASTTTIENNIKGGFFQMNTTGGLGDNISAYLEIAGPAKNAKCAIYDNSLNLLENGTTQEVSYSAGWNTFSFNLSSKPILKPNQ
jgi:hypothetical protein